MQRTLKNIGVGILALGAVVWAVPAFAQVDPHLMAGNIPGCNFMSGKIEYVCIPNYVGFLVKTVFGFIGTIFLVQVMLAGGEIGMGTLTGDKEGGKKKLKDAILGLVFCILCFRKFV
jgi:hypothetical protein